MNNKILIESIIAVVILVLVSSSSAIDVNINGDNHPPKIPSNPIPEDGETDVPIDGIFLDWTGDPLRNDVYLGKSNPPPLVAENLSTTWYDPGLMDTNTMYYWQIVAKDYAGSKTPGPIWNFTTGSRTNRPPNAPEITAEKIGESTFIIRFKLTDPDGDNLISFAVQWNKDDFIFVGSGNWPNGTIIEEMKGYSRGKHQIKASCADRWSICGDWGYLEIEVSKSQVQSRQMINLPFLQWLDRFPILNQIIMRLMES